jgi:ADP-ribose pyrophosphatase
MSERDRAPLFPRIRLEMLEDLSPDTGAGFLRLSRRRLVARYPDGTVSNPFLYDTVDRQALDAVVIAAHYLAADGRHVFLRSSIRPPIYYRAPDDSAAEPGKRGQLWELPAGLVEPSEVGDSGLRRAAIRELHEEAGFPLDGSRLSELGPALYPCPGVIAEKLFFFDIEVDPVTRSDPPLDGSALERFGEVVDVPLSFALSLCRGGDIEDAKTEIGLRRLSEKYS